MNTNAETTCPNEARTVAALPHATWAAIAATAESSLAYHPAYPVYRFVALLRATGQGPLTGVRRHAIIDEMLRGAAVAMDTPGTRRDQFVTLLPFLAAATLLIVPAGDPAMMAIRLDLWQACRRHKDPEERHAAMWRIAAPFLGLSVA
jgi:hypothetical protein